MADNLTVQPDHGSTTEEILSFDELAGAVLVQRVKIQHGTDGTATDASASNPLPVTGTMAISGTPAVTISGTPTVAVASMPTVSLAPGAEVDLAAGAEVTITTGELLESLQQIVRLLGILSANAGTPDLAARLRVNVETGAVTISSGTVTTVTTVTTLANIAAIGGYNAQHMIPSLMNIEAQGNYSRIEIT